MHVEFASFLLTPNLTRVLHTHTLVDTVHLVGSCHSRETLSLTPRLSNRQQGPMPNLCPGQSIHLPLLQRKTVFLSSQKGLWYLAGPSYGGSKVISFPRLPAQVFSYSLRVQQSYRKTPKPSYRKADAHMKSPNAGVFSPFRFTNIPRAKRLQLQAHSSHFSYLKLPSFSHSQRLSSS